MQYLVANQGQARFLVATPTSSYASVFMLATDQPAMALGGYQGWDRILTPAELAALVQRGTVRFFLLAGTGGSGFSDGLDTTVDLSAWVRSSCVSVPSAQWQSASGAVGTTTNARANSGPQTQSLYDCGNRVTTQR